MDLQSIFHFDFYTIDFNGELSALFGGTLRDQHEFIVSCISKVLNLYPIPNRPKSVIIIGHSMVNLRKYKICKSESLINIKFTSLMFTNITN